MAKHGAKPNPPHSSPVSESRRALLQHVVELVVAAAVGALCMLPSIRETSQDAREARLLTERQQEQIDLLNKRVQELEQAGRQLERTLYMILGASRRESTTRPVDSEASPKN
jgi:hypothetical protein